MTDAVFISDTAGQFIEFNDAFATFHRFKTKADCAKRLADYPVILEVSLPNGELAPLDMWAVPRALRGETATNAEYTLRRKDTGETWVGSYSFSPVRDKEGAIVGSVVVGRDITERKRDEESLRRQPKAMRLPLSCLERNPAMTRTSRRAIARFFAELVVFAALALGITSCGYNDIIDRDESVKAAWAEVENQYQRRADLVPNLVNTVKGAASFEKGTLEAVVEARAKVGQIKVDSSTIDDPAKLKQFEQAQGQLSSSLSRLLVVSEQYPALRATDAFRDLTVQLEGTENRIAVARRRYVGEVAEYNKTVLRFPSSIGASIRGKKERPTFSATTPGADKVPEVKF
jgi:LemA protein